MRTQHNLYVGERTSEKIKIQVGAATEDLETPPEDMLVQGRDLLSGKPKQVQISFREISKALDKSPKPSPSLSAYQVDSIHESSSEQAYQVSV